MPRRAWFDPETSAPFNGSVERLESWQAAIEDGVIEPHEVEAQQSRVVALLRELEPMLDDRQHEQVTRVLEELTVLQAMHGTLLAEDFGFRATLAPDEVPIDAHEDGAPPDPEHGENAR